MVRRNDPKLSLMVVDFLASNAPRGPHEVPHYINWALSNLPKAWTTNLDVVAHRQSPDAAKAVFALALQTVMMAAQAVRDFEERPSTARLQTELEVARK
ncbi:hypothetical protein OROMI_006089 [Orobanche minor]